MTHVIDSNGNILVAVDGLDAIANASGEGASVDADGTLTVKLGDNAGTEKLSITDSDDAEVASVDSAGRLVISSDLTASDDETYISVVDGDAVERFLVNSYGFSVWQLYNGASNCGEIEFTTPAGDPGIVFWTGTPGAYTDRFDMRNNDTANRFSMGFATADSRDRLNLFQSGNLTLGTTNDRGPRLLVKSGDGQHGIWGYDGVDGTARTVISNGTDDVAYVLHVTWAVRDSAGNTAAASGSATPGNTLDLYDDGGTNTLQLTVNADGSVEVQRTAGSRTYKVALDLLWI